jgi:8-oxo-dGTP pyrophosphatase MutT (NUDIX family)
VSYTISFFGYLYMFSEVALALETQLRQPLPGSLAQRKMRPYLPSMPNLDIPSSPFAKESAVMALLYPKENQPSILLIERNVYTGAHSGQISLPGGKLEKNETYQEAAIRETMEEVGVKNSEFQIIGELSKIYVAASNFNIQPFVAISDSPLQIYPDSREVAQVLEIPLEFFFDMKLRKEKLIKSAMGMELMAPYFDVNNKTLWGATAMILSELVEIIQLSKQDFLKY